MFAFKIMQEDIYYKIYIVCFKNIFISTLIINLVFIEQKKKLGCYWLQFPKWFSNVPTYKQKKCYRFYVKMQSSRSY